MATVVKLVATGREICARRLLGTGSEPKRIRWGTGTTAPEDTDYELETQSNEGPVTGVSSVDTTDTTGDTYRVVGTMTSNSEQTITEAGLFNTNDDLFIRGTFDGIPLENGDSIQFTIDGQFIAT